MQIEVAPPQRAGTALAADAQFLSISAAGWNSDLEGLLSFFPINENLDGFAMSEFPFGRRADRQSFAMRNRIVAGMCEGVIVVETDVSGGSMITARPS